jgi:hypothetical protein
MATPRMPVSRFRMVRGRVLHFGAHCERGGAVPVGKRRVQQV